MGLYPEVLEQTPGEAGKQASCPALSRILMEVAQ